MTQEEIINRLYEHQDEKYRDFQGGLIPGIDPESMIGVRTPELRKLAKEIAGSGAEGFLNALPHRYFEENQLHAFIISGIKDKEEALRRVEEFLPYVDNWATCDQMSLKCFKKNPWDIYPAVMRWIYSGSTYTIRFGIGYLMEFMLDEHFHPTCLEVVSAVKSEEYYVRMMIAWYFATALAKQYEFAVSYLEQRLLDPWTHRKTIQKALESFRVTPEHKEYLRTLRRL